MKSFGCVVSLICERKFSRISIDIRIRDLTVDLHPPLCLEEQRGARTEKTASDGETVRNAAVFLAVSSSFFLVAWAANKAKSIGN